MNPLAFQNFGISMGMYQADQALVRARGDEFAREMAGDIHYALTGLNRYEKAAVRAASKVREMGKWEDLKAAFQWKYREDVEDWIPKRLDARRNKDSCEVYEYAKLLYSPEAASDAHTFFSRCWSGTDNEALAELIDETAGYENGKVTDEGASRLVHMMCCYGECYWWHNAGENKSAFKYSDELSPVQQHRITRFSAVLQYELEGTGNLNATRKVIQMAIDKYCAVRRAGKGADPKTDGNQPKDERGLPVPMSGLPGDLHDLVLPSRRSAV